MALTQLAPPYPIFTDKSGDPLDNGYLYFGEVNKNPETNPIQVYYDSAFTQPAAQPLRTSNGYVMRNGSPALIYAGSQFSVTVRDKNNALVIYSPVGYGIDPGSITGSVVYDDFTGDGSTLVFTLSASPSTKNATNVYIDGVYQSKDNYSTSGSTLTFSTAPPLNSAIEVVTQESSIIGGASSQQISYTQGGAGSVTRTVQSRLRDFVSVKDFGAVGDGVTDDTAAIQAALDSGATTVFVPQGDYKTTNSIDIPDFVSVEFAPSVTITFDSTDFYVFDIGKGVKIVGNGVLIDCVNASWNGGAIQVDGVNRYADDYPAALDGINVQGVSSSKGTGLYLTATDAADFISFVRFSNFTFHRMNFGLTLNCGASGDIGNVSTWHWINGNVFENFNYYGTNYGMSLIGLTGVPAEVNGNMFINHLFQVGSTAIYLDGASSNTFSNIYVFDWNYGSGDAIVFGNGANSNIVFSNIRNEGITGGATNYCQTPIGEFTAPRRFKSDVNIEGYCEVDGAVTSGGDLWVQDTSSFKTGYTGLQGSIIGSDTFTITPRSGYETLVNSQTSIGGLLKPSVNNTYSLGSASFLWTEVFAANGSINTSDREQKQNIEPIDEAVLRAWGNVNFCQFKFKDAVEKKGDAARIHIGVIAQEIKSAFEDEGLDPFAYGVLCFDEWDDQYEDVEVSEEYKDENGKICTRPVKTGEKRLIIAAGSRYGVRYNEVLALECAYLRSKISGDLQ